MRGSSMRVFGAAWLAVLCLSSPSAAQRTDVLTIENGDQITGEVKGLDRGVLTYKTDDAGTLSVKWLHVLSLRSLDIFEVEVASENLYWGPLGVGDQPGILLVGGEALVLRDVVGITPIEAGFWARTSGFLDAGFNFAKADARRSLTLDGQMRYRGRKWGSSSSFQYYQQEQESADRLRRASLGLDGSYYFGPLLRNEHAPMWAGRVFWQATTNDELSLKLRNLIGGGLQRRLRNSSRSEASATLGILESRETYLDEEDPIHSIELLLMGDLGIYFLDSPKLDVSIIPTMFIGLTEWGRVRAGFDGRVKYELLKDVFISVIGNASLDTRPPSETAAKSDYSASFTIGWSWS
jgi:hypothetical protein